MQRGTQRKSRHTNQHEQVGEAHPCEHYDFQQAPQPSGYCPSDWKSDQGHEPESSYGGNADITLRWLKQRLKQALKNIEMHQRCYSQENNNCGNQSDYHGTPQRNRW
jgi:hypothetical protein